MKIVLISDTHQQHRKITIPECDLLIHSGDACNWGNEIEFLSFANWMNEQTQAKHRVYSPGNHDWHVEREPAMARSALGDTHLLVGESITLAGLNIHGIPWSPAFCSWAFQADDDDRNEGYTSMETHLRRMPATADILVTHGPPYGLLDKNAQGEHCGSKTVRRWLDRGTFPDSLRLITCGHIHEGAGVSDVIGGIALVNAAKDPLGPDPITVLQW